MSLELRNVTYRVGADLYHRRDQPRARGRHVQHPPRPDARRQDDADADHGRADRADLAASSSSAARTSRGVPVQKRNVAMVYQQFINYPNFTVFENIASPLRVAGVPAAEIKAKVGKAAELLRLTPMLQPASVGTVRRPAAADGDRPRAGQGLRPHPPRRAARQSRLQAPRGTPRRAAPLLRRRPAHRRLRHHRADRGAPLRRQHRDAARGPHHPVRPDRRHLSQAVRPDHGRGLLRPADQHRTGRKQRRRDPDRRRDPPSRRQGRRRGADGDYTIGIRPASHQPGRPRRRRARSRAASSSPS